MADPCGRPDLLILADALEDTEGPDLALGVLRVEEVDQCLEPSHVADGELIHFVAKVKVPQRTQSDHRGRLITTLEVFDQFLDLPVLGG